MLIVLQIKVVFALKSGNVRMRRSTLNWTDGDVYAATFIIKYPERNLPMAQCIICIF